MENYALIYVFALSAIAFITIGIYLSKIKDVNNLTSFLLLSDKYIDAIKRIVKTSIEIMGVSYTSFPDEESFHNAVATLALKEVKVFIVENGIMTEANVKKIKDETIIDIIELAMKSYDSLIEEYRNRLKNRDTQ